MSGADPGNGARGAESPPQAAALQAGGEDAGFAASSTLPAVPPPPPVPREVTAAASRRAWHEPRVHFWWIVAIGLVAGATWLAVEQTIRWNYDASLIRSGTRIDAVAWLWGARVKGRPIAEDDVARIEFDWNGQPQVLEGQRIVGRGVPTHSGDTIPIFVDPEDPTRWTARTSPASLPNMLVGSMAVVILAALLLLVSVLKRRGVLATWRNGEARPAAVVETSHTALAPRSRLVRCALTDGSDKRLINVCIPLRAATLQPGDGLWLIMPPGKPEKSVAAMLYN